MIDLVVGHVYDRSKGMPLPSRGCSREITMMLYSGVRISRVVVPTTSVYHGAALNSSTPRSLSPPSPPRPPALARPLCAQRGPPPPQRHRTAVTYGPLGAPSIDHPPVAILPHPTAGLSPQTPLSTPRSRPVPPSTPSCSDILPDHVFYLEDYVNGIVIVDLEDYFLDPVVDSVPDVEAPGKEGVGTRTWLIWMGSRMRGIWPAVFASKVYRRSPRLDHVFNWSKIRTERFPFQKGKYP